MPKNNNKIASKIVWNLTQINSEMTEILIYDAIADKQSIDFWTGEKGTEVTPALFKDELDKITTPDICVRINSGGGDVFAAEAIRTAIREKRKEGKSVTCKIDGICGSAAVGIAMACEKRSIPSSAYLMVHDPMIFLFDYMNISELEKHSSLLKTVKQGIVNAYVEATGKDREEISDLMAAETWYTGMEAVKNGFCDELMFEENFVNLSESPVNKTIFDIAMYRNCPEILSDKHILNKNKKSISRKGETEDMEIKTADDLRSAYPELTAQIANEAAISERSRIKDIENIALAGFDNIISSAKFENPVSAAEVAVQIVAEQKKQGENYLNKANDDVRNSSVNNVRPGIHEGANDRENPYKAAIDKIFPSKN